MHVLPIIIDRQHMRYEPKERAEKKEKERKRRKERVVETARVSHM